MVWQWVHKRELFTQGGIFTSCHMGYISMLDLLQIFRHRHEARKSAAADIYPWTLWIAKYMVGTDNDSIGGLPLMNQSCIMILCCPFFVFAVSCGVNLIGLHTTGTYCYYCLRRSYFMSWVFKDTFGMSLSKNLGTWGQIFAEWGQISKNVVEYSFNKSKSWNATIQTHWTVDGINNTTNQEGCRTYSHFHNVGTSLFCLFRTCLVLSKDPVQKKHKQTVWELTPVIWILSFCNGISWWWQAWVAVFWFQEELLWHRIFRQ